jgi:hypothetical protein
MRTMENPQRILYRFLHEATNPLSFRFLREATGRVFYLLLNLIKQNPLVTLS